MLARILIFTCIISCAITQASAGIQSRSVIRSKKDRVVALPPNASPEFILWNKLEKPFFNTDRVFAIQNVKLQRDVARITFVKGFLGLSQPVGINPDGEKTVSAVFRGQGRLHFAPTRNMEKQQLAFHAEKPIEALDINFTEAVLLFTDQTYKELSGVVGSRYTNVQTMMERKRNRSSNTHPFEKVYNNRNKTWTKYGYNWEPRLLKSLLSNKPSNQSLFVAEIKTDDYKWLTLIIDQVDPEQVELVQYDFRSKIQPVTVFSKFPAENRHPEEAYADPFVPYDYQIKSYALDVTIDRKISTGFQSNPLLRVRAEVLLEIKKSDERVLIFSLDPNLQVQEVFDNTGKPLNFFQSSDPKDDYFLGGGYLVVTSPTPFKKGLASFRFIYEGRRVVIETGPGQYFCQSFGWYPSYNFGRGITLSNTILAWRSDFDITLKVPGKYRGISVGNKIEDSTNKGFRGNLDTAKDYHITRWKSEIPLSVAGFAFGDYNTEQEDVGEVSVEVYASRRSSYFHDPNENKFISAAGYAKDMLNEVINALTIMETYFGPYPYNKLAVTDIPFYYGQGWPSLLYVSIIGFLDSTKLNFFGMWPFGLDWSNSSFRAHEVSHQWWGHRLAFKSYHDQWISEGFAEFSGLLFDQHTKGKEEYFRLLKGMRESLVVKNRRGVKHEQVGPVYAGLRLSSNKHPRSYNEIVYKKGGWILHMIRQMLYDPRHTEDPDGRFIMMMHDLTSTFHNQAISTGDFKRILEQHMTDDMDIDGNGTMDWFFNSWVHGTGIPHYTLKHTITKTGQPGVFEFSGVLRQSGVPKDFRMMVPLFIHLKKGIIRVGWLYPVEGENQFQFQLPLPTTPLKLSINAWEDVLSTVKYE